VANRWEDIDDLFVQCATDDLEAAGEIRPGMAAFAGDRLRFLAWLRPFAKGAYHKPLIELFALAGPLDADRLALSIAARVWSLDDPIPPVTREVDLRQRVLMLHVVDGAQGRPRSHTVMRSFELGPDGPEWGARNVLTGGEGWIIQAMEIVVRDRHKLRAPLAEIAKQATRVVSLGHSLYLTEDVALLLAPHVGTRSR
jgi:hypothetical protein